MAKLSQQEIDIYLDEPHIAHMVTVWPDGRPHVAPVWFLEEDGRAFVMTDGNAVKVRNIRRGSTVSLSLATDQRPLKYVVLNGEAQVSASDMEEMVERICVRYDGSERGPAYARELLAEPRMCLIEIRITRVIGWKDDE